MYQKSSKSKISALEMIFYQDITQLGSVAGPVIQANGRLTFEDDLGQEACYDSLHSEPTSALGLPTVWSPWGNPGMVRCEVL